MMFQTGFAACSCLCLRKIVDSNRVGRKVATIAMLADEGLWGGGGIRAQSNGGKKRHLLCCDCFKEILRNSLNLTLG
jgi:hypothetical protein